MSDLEERVQLVSQLLKSTLENFDLFLGVDAKTEEFIFLDRKGWREGKAHYAKVKMDEINIK